jgi:hypothetical protein
VTSATTPAVPPPKRPPAICSTCGAVAAAAVPVNWSASLEGGRRLWTCDGCARRHVRSIEAKLDSAWW